MGILKTLLQNTTQVENITANGYITQQGIYGGIHVHDNAVAQSIANGASYVKVTAFTDNNLYRNMTPDAANDKITVTIPGRYQVSGSFSILAGTANTIWWGSVFVNGVEQDSVHFKRKIAVAGDVGSLSFSGPIEVATAGLDVDFRVRHDNGAAVNLTVAYGNLHLTYVGTL